MEGLSPPLRCLIEIQAAMQNGEAVRSGVMRYLHSSLSSVDDDFANFVRRFLFAWDQGQNWRDLIAKASSPHRRALLELIATGLAGQPILSNLEELRLELIRATETEVERFVDLLPLRMLIPLLLFQFPAFLMLLFGPLLSRLVEEIGK